MGIHRGPTAFTRFRTAAPFDLKLSLFHERFRQGPDGSKDYYTRNGLIRRQIQAAGPAARVMAEGVAFRCLPAEDWRRDWASQRVMFVLPSDALGDCVGVVLFLRAFRKAFPQVRVTVANTGAATDIFGREEGLRVLPLVVSEKELAQHHPIIDLGEVDGWDAVVTQPVDVETVLLRRFGLEPVAVPVRMPAAPPSLAIFPMASSPLRTLPPKAVARLAGALGEVGPVKLVLNSYQRVMAAYERALRPLLPRQAEILPGFDTTGGLLECLAAQDFVVVADSGPAHLTKLFGIPGLAVYTSASGAVLQGRHTNLGLWQVPFSGPHCTAPCGLAKLRAGADGQVGCMGSLGRPLDELPHLPKEDPDTAERLVVDQPVPCVAQLNTLQDDLAAHAITQIRRIIPSC